MANDLIPPDSHVPSGRKIISVLLLFHLCALSIGVISNAGSESPLRSSLRNVPLVASYLQLLNMDQAYDDALTYGAPADGAHYLQFAAAENSAESTEDELLLPDDSTWPRIRRQRYENLAMQIDELAVAFEGDPHSQTLLATGVAERLLRERDATPGMYTLRCLRRPLMPLEVDNPDDISTEPEAVVETRVLLRDNGELRIALQEKDNLTAGVVASDAETSPIKQELTND